MMEFYEPNAKLKELLQIFKDTLGRQSSLTMVRMADLVRQYNLGGYGNYLFV